MGGSTRSTTNTERLLWMLALGLLIQVGCCILALSHVPHLRYATGGPIGVEQPIEVGDRALVLVGIVGFGLGGALSLIAVIALGVLLGMRAHASAD